jgi:hypothetical protein
VISLTSQPLSLEGKNFHYPSITSWVGLRAVWDFFRREIFLPLPEIDICIVQPIA